MMRRTIFVLFFVFFSLSNAFPKFKEDEQHYLDDQFKALQDQLTALTTQLQSLNAQLQELRQNQAEFKAIIARQRQSLQDLDQMATSIRLGSEENFSNLKTAISQLRNDTQNEFVKLTGGSVSPSRGGGTSTPTAPGTGTQGYVTAVDGDNVMVDMGSTQGLHEGSRLVLFKASDPTTRVGVLEVTQVIDAGTSRTRVVTLNGGVKPEFSDVVRLE